MRTISVLLFTVLLVLVLSPIDSGITARRPEKPRDDRTPFTNDCLLGVVDPTASEQVLAVNNILYVKDALLAGAIVLNDNSPLSGEVEARVSGSWNTTTLVGSFDGKWTITNANGTFEGSIVGTISVATISGRFVGRGTDALQGQKIKGTMTGTVNNYVADLTLSGDVTANANVKLKNKMVMTPIIAFVE
jgi:Na+/proline symporter